MVMEMFVGCSYLREGNLELVMAVVFRVIPISLFMFSRNTHLRLALGSCSVSDRDSGCPGISGIRRTRIINNSYPYQYHHLSTCPRSVE